MASAAAKSNVRIVEDTYEAFNDGDIDTVLSSMADDIEWVEPEGSPYGDVHRGPEAVLENVFQPCLEDFADFRVETDRFIDGDDIIVVLGTFRGTNRETDKELDVPYAHVCELEDGRMSRFVDYSNALPMLRTYEK
ncbi:nuclear transport factor 2 family protein [Haladaptatus salinisoli]|uniref:nuclear transport factor 2 family protein n=1 Tax=Haladaptatus salinisoli TaxID=2884876 RepID=UPI001D0B0C7A|nr:nuclear transport factor 2 family protein [Haladaptatus salinisoli]